MSRHATPGAGAYLIGPVTPNPALLGYSAASFAAPTPHRPLSFPQTTMHLQTEPEISEQAVVEAIERLTKAPGNSPEALQQAALDMELVISHFDSLSAAFGAEAALTSLALDLAANSHKERQAKAHKGKQRKSTRTTKVRRTTTKLSAAHRSGGTRTTVK